MERLIQAVSRLAKAQEDANRINQDFIEYRIRKDEESEVYAKELHKKQHEESKKQFKEVYEQNEKLTELLNGQLQEAIKQNNAQIIAYINQKIDDLNK